MTGLWNLNVVIRVSSRLFKNIIAKGTCYVKQFFLALNYLQSAHNKN